MRVEQRQYRATYAPGTTYALDAEVYYTDGTDEGYFVSLQASNTGHTPSFAADTEWWAAADEDFVASLDFDQSWATMPIGQIDPAQDVFEEDPRVHANSAPVPDCEILDGALVVRCNAPVRPWIRFMRRAPKFTRVAYNAGTTYAAAALVLGADGDCYESLAGSNVGNTPASSPTWWRKQEFPEFLREYVIAGSFSETLREDEERYRALADARRELEDLAGRYADRMTGAKEVTWEV
jgi:hypothetical protein